MTLTPLFASAQTFAPTETSPVILILTVSTLIVAVMATLNLIFRIGVRNRFSMLATAFVAISTLIVAGILLILDPSEDHAKENRVANIKTALPGVEHVWIFEDSRAALLTEDGTLFEVLLEEDPETYEPSFTPLDQGSAGEFHQRFRPLE